MDSKNTVNETCANFPKNNSKKIPTFIWLIVGLIMIAGFGYATTVSDIGLIDAPEINNDCYALNGTDIQTKINSCDVVSLFDDVTYTVTTPILLKSDLTIKGQTTSTTLNCGLITNGACFYTNARIYRVQMANMRIQGNVTSPNTGSIGLDMSNISASRFDNLDISSFNKGIYSGSQRGGSQAYAYYNNWYNLKSDANNINIELANHTNENRFIGGYSTRSLTGNTLRISDLSDNNQFIGFSFEGVNENITLDTASFDNGFYASRLECSGQCYLIFNSNGHSWIGGFFSSASYIDNGANNYVLLRGSAYSSNSVPFNYTLGIGSLNNLNTLGTINISTDIADYALKVKNDITDTFTRLGILIRCGQNTGVCTAVEIQSGNGTTLTKLQGRQDFAGSQTGLQIQSHLQVGDGTSQKNITMTAPNGTEYNCGISNTGVFGCIA